MKWNEAEMVALVGRRAADWEGKLTYRWVWFNSKQFSSSYKTESGAPLYLHENLGDECSWNNSTQATEGRRNLC